MKAEFADAVVVAAGRSERFGGDKLAARVGERPLLAWTLEALSRAPRIRQIVVVVAEDRVGNVASATWLPPKVAAVTAGGARRQESVAAGLARLDKLENGGDDGSAIVLVHDGARPLVSVGLVDAVVQAAAEHGAAIPVVPVADTLKQVDDGWVAGTIDRAGVGLAQTPQGFRRSVLRDALASQPGASGETWTDEAALLEACKIRVHAIPGDPSNLKVTLPDDLRGVEMALLGDGPLRVGVGQDAHPFGPGGPLAIGGIELPGAPRLHGHSDGDVVLHAVADALLGAAGLGDLGRLFPSDARTPRGIASTELLRDVIARLAAERLRPTGVDVTIVGARPRLGSRLDDIRDRLALLLDLPVSAVNVKASTGNLAGMEGAGRGISAQAIAQLVSVR